MLTSSVLPNLIQFYPLGNTPADSLTRTLPQGVDASILLLGCGDARNILYTAYYESGFPPRTLDFTCCDVIEHIHVRNALLLSFLVDGLETDKQADLLWDVYYHLYIDGDAVELLRHQVDKLVEASESIEQWRASVYGKHLRFCNRATFNDFQKGLVKYGEAFSSMDAPEYERTFAKRMDNLLRARKEKFGDKQLVFSGMQSIGPIFTAVKDLSDSHSYYWKHGITSAPVSSKMTPNPTFATVMSETVRLHYGTDPIHGFHLATAYSKVTDSSPLRIGPEVPGASDTVKAARTEFRAMVRAFQAARDRIVVRFATADALAFCHTLQNFQSTGSLSGNWFRRQPDGQVLDLDADEYGNSTKAPSRFDVIDTSNLADHLGTLNLLVAGVPLLTDKPSSSIFTEMLLSQDGSRKTFDKLLCGHTPTVALLMGITPVEYCTNARSIWVLDDFLKKMDTPQSRSRLTWKPSHHFSGHGEGQQKIAIDPSDLASVFMSMFREMFHFENPLAMVALKHDAMELEKYVLKNGYPHFHRGSLAAVMRLVKDRVATDWTAMCHEFTGMTFADRTLLLATNYVQDFAAHLHMWNVHTEDWLVSDVKDKTRPLLSAITLVIPRKEVNKLVASIALVNSPSPTLVVGLRSADLVGPDAFHNLFADVHFMFGTVTTRGARNSPDFRVDVAEDPLGWNGTGPLIACFYVPRALLQLVKPTATVALELNGDPHTTLAYGRSVDPTFGIYAAKISDASSVYITTFLPGQEGHAQVHPPAPVFAEKGEVTVAVERSTGRATSIRGHIPIDSAKGKKLLSDKSVGIQLAPSESPFAIDVVFGKRALVCPVHFPVAVADKGARARIARTSSWIEVVAQLADPAHTASLDDFIYPIVRNKDGLPETLSGRHISLDVLPILDVSDKESISWLTILASMMFSSRERQIRDATQAVSGGGGISADARVNFKESLFTLFILSSGLQGKETGLFAINHPERGGIHMLLFVSALRWDGASASVVADAAILPLTVALLEDTGLQSFLTLARSLEMCTIQVDDAELRLWKKLVPALAERCRTWMHNSDCEYAKPGARIPLGLELGEPVLCSCGRGQLPDDFVGVPLWEEVAPFATRVAINPVFCVPFVEESVDASFWPDPNLDATGSQPAAAGNACKSCGAAKAEKGGPLKKCARCQAAAYCSVACQKKDWPKHRATCKK